MASPTINWDDFENQALLVQELLSDPQEIADGDFTSDVTVPTDLSDVGQVWLGDSPLLITSMAMPQTLLMLSPETHLYSEEKYETVALTPVERGSKNSSLQHQEREVKTPLKDCTNISQDCKILTNNMVTPENYKSNKKSERTLCPSSAEFRKFLDDIMAVSPVMNVCVENAEEATENQCQLQVASDTPKSLPVVKVHARRGTYDLDEPSCDLSILSVSENKSVLEQPELESKSLVEHLMKPTPDLLIDLSADTPRKASFVADQNSIVLSNDVHRLQVSETYAADTSDQTIPRQTDNTQVQNSNTEILKCDSELRDGNDERHNDLMEVQDVGNEVQKGNTMGQKVNNEAQSVEVHEGSEEDLYIQVHKDSNEAQKDITENNEDQEGVTEVQVSNEALSVEVHKDSNEAQKDITENNEDQEGVTEVQVSNEALSVEVHEDSNEGQKDITEVWKDNIKTHKAIPEVNEDKTEEQKALTVSNSDLNALKPSRKMLFKHSNLKRPNSRFSSASVGVCVKSQAPVFETVDIDHILHLNRTPACEMAEESAASEITALEYEETALEKPNSIQKREENSLDASEKTVESADTELSDFKHAISSASSSDDSSAEKQNISDALPEAHCKTSASASDLPGKTTDKTDICPSTVVLKKVPVSKLPLMRPGQIQSKLRRPSSGLASLQSQRAFSVLDEGIKRSNAVLPLKPVIKQHIESSDLGHKKTQETSRVLPKLTLRPPNKVSEQHLLPSKVPSGHSKLEAKACEQAAVKSLQPHKIQSALSLEGTQPVATKLACRPSMMKGNLAAFKGKAPVKTGLQIDGSRTVTKRPSPMKALFPYDGSRTITKDVRPDMSRTVTKAVQPAGSRTVTKTSDVPQSKTPKHRQSTPGTTDKFIAPRRLSNVFNKSSSSSYASKNSLTINHPLQRSELDSSSFESVVTVDESGAFKVES